MVGDDADGLEGELAEYQLMLSRLIAKNPDDRYESADELLTALSAYMPRTP